jgi:Acetyltransferases
MIIRDYQARDEEGWLRCRVLSFLHTAYFDNVLQKKETYGHPSVQLIAIKNGGIIGLIDVEYETESQTVCTLCSDRGGMIWNLAVHPDFQREGIGTALLLEAEKRLGGLGIHQLEAWTRDDAWVNNWYQKQGFKMMSRYLHVFLNSEESGDVVQTSVSGLQPVELFAHASIEEKEEMQQRFCRVHECRGYFKELK